MTYGTYLSGAFITVVLMIHRSTVKLPVIFLFQSELVKTEM